jgi:hypothetical protein
LPLPQPETSVPSGERMRLTIVVGRGLPLCGGLVSEVHIGWMVMDGLRLRDIRSAIAKSVRLARLRIEDREPTLRTA